MATGQFKPHHIVTVIVHWSVTVDIRIDPDHAGVLVDHVQAKLIGKQREAVLLFIFDKIVSIQNLTPVAADHAVGHVGNIVIGKQRDLLALVDKRFQAELFHPRQRAPNPKRSDLAHPRHTCLSPLFSACLWKQSGKIEAICQCKA